MLELDDSLCGGCSFYSISARYPSKFESQGIEGVNGDEEVIRA
jgi:hypothetical protein